MIRTAPSRTAEGRWTRVAIVAAFLASTLSTPTIAHAAPPAASASTDDENVDIDRPLSNPPPQPTEDARKTAADLYNQGMASARKGRVKEALALFRAAYEQDGSPEALANMAVIEASLGRPRAAAEHLARMLQNLPVQYASKADDLKRRLAEQAALVGRVRVQVGTEGEVFADGKWLGTGPFTTTLYVDPGSHSIRLQARGVVVERTFKLEKGEIGIADITPADVEALVAKLPKPAPPPPPPAPVSKAVVATGASLAVAFAALGGVGVGVAVRAAGEQAKIDGVVKQFGGSCPASSPGFEDDCHARQQEAGNETVGKILTTAGFAGAVLAGAGTLMYVTLPGLRGSASPSAAKLEVAPALGGVVVRGTF